MLFYLCPCFSLRLFVSLCHKYYIMNKEINISERFSIYPCGWWDEEEQKAKPQQRQQQTQTIAWAYEYITSTRAEGVTEKLRGMMLKGATDQQLRDYKVLNFEYATFSGVFRYRRANYIASRTPFLTIDIDHLSSTEEARELQQRFIQDRELETVLCFLSPKGLGLKWVVCLPGWTDGLPFKQQFDAVRNYVGFEYGHDPDKSGSDICRACFLPYDPLCYVNDKYLLNNKQQ